MSSTGLSAYAIWKASQWEQVQECFKIYEKDEMIEYLKTANCSDLLKCNGLRPSRFRSIWVPTIESPCVPGAFMTKMPEEMYKSNEVLPIDAMFSMTTQVLNEFDSIEMMS